MTQGEPLLPTILNVVVDALVHHWESLLAEKAGRGKERLWQRGTAGGKDNPGKRQRTKAEVGGTCAAEGEDSVILSKRRDGGLHQPRIDPDCV